MTRTGKIYDDHRKFTLRILYDQTGRPILWSPVSRYNEVNITYSPSGLVTFIQRGTWNEKTDYDQSGKIISRAWADGKIWSYTYLEKVSMWEGKWIQILNVTLRTQLYEDLQEKNLCFHCINNKTPSWTCTDALFFSWKHPHSYPLPSILFFQTELRIMA